MPNDDGDDDDEDDDDDSNDDDIIQIIAMDLSYPTREGPRWIPCTKASDTELWCFLWSASE